MRERRFEWASKKQLDEMIREAELTIETSKIYIQQSREKLKALKAEKARRIS